MKKVKVVVSWLLCVVMLLGVLPLSAYAAEDTEPTGELVEEIVYELMTDEELNEFSPYVDVAYAKELGHVMRLEEEETLNSLVFLNMDGSKSKYCFSSNIKYADENGNLVLIDSSTDLSSIPAVMSIDNRSDIDRTVVYTNVNTPRYNDSLYMVGSIDSALGTGYMLVRLNGFCENGEYADFDPEQIMEVKLNFFGNANAKYSLMACPYIGSDWEVESAASGNTSRYYSSLYTSFATYTGYSLMYTFNLTDMTKAWLRGEYDSEKGVYISTYIKDGTATGYPDYISVYSSSSFGYVVTYSTLTTELTAANYDKQAGYEETEPNDTKATANIAVTKDRTTRTANSVIHGVIGYDPDTDIDDKVDWYAAYLQTGDTVDIKLYNINYAADLDMIVYNISGGTITSNNNTNGMAEYVTYTAMNSGWIYIKVYGTVGQLSSYSLVIKRDIRVSGKGIFSSSQSLYAINPDKIQKADNSEPVNYMYRLGRDVADSSSKITFLSFSRPAVQSNGSQTTYGIDLFGTDYCFRSFSVVESYIELFIDGFNDNPDHDEIEELAIMVTSNGISYDNHYNEEGKIDGVLTKENPLYYIDFGKEFAQMIERVNSKLKTTDKVKKIVGGFDFELDFGMNYMQCKAFETGYFANTDELLYVMADINNDIPSNISYTDYHVGNNWYLSMIYDLCMNHTQLRCIPQISLEIRIDRWINFCRWSEQANWGSNLDKLAISISAISPITLYGLDCCNSFNDGGGEYYSLEESVRAFVTAYSQYSTDLSNFQYITWMAMTMQAQLN